MDESLKAQLNATLDMIPAFTWYAEPSCALLFVNSRCADYLGLPQDHPLRFGTDRGSAWDSHIPFLHPDDHEEMRRVGSDNLRTGGTAEASCRIRDGQGNYRWFLNRVEPLRAADGTVQYWIGINLDIEERKQAEFYLAEGERLAHTGSWTFTPAGFEYWSPELFAIHGLDPTKRAPTFEEYMALVHPDDRDFVAQVIRTMVAEHRGFDFTKRIVRSDGSVRHVRCVGTPATNSGVSQRFVGTGIDVTEHEVLTSALRKSEEELRQVLNLAPQFIAVFGRHLERLFMNRSGLDYFGLTLEEWRDKPPVCAVGHPDDAERIQVQWDRAMSMGSAFESEVRFRKGDGSYRWFLARYNPLRDEQGQITRWYVAGTDIEDRKQAEERLEQENVALREEIDKTSMFEEIVGTSRSLKAVLSRIAKVAPTDSTVLITGETGTGKELIARAVHKRSQRSGCPFVSVNCAALPPTLVSSELFGHEKGAFTGATQRRLGRFEMAEGGTIFLDEVGELLPDTQAALLRVLQEREFERVGGGQPIHVDVRVIAATNRDLNAAVANGTFRQDLLYRLNVFPIEMPPLRERKDDILILVEYFVQRYANRAGRNIRSIDKKTLDLLQSYDWPGNIRELQNVIERSVILTSGDVFAVDELWLSRRTPSQTPRVETSPAMNVEPRSEREIIEAALAETRGRVSGPSGAAAKLRVPPSTLETRIKASKINKQQFKFG